MRCPPPLPTPATVMLFLPLLCLWSAMAHAEPKGADEAMGCTLSVPGGIYERGESVEIAVELTYAGAERVTALALEQRLPTGWTFLAVTGGDVPQFVPAPDAAGTIAFAWVSIPSFPVSFRYRAHVPASATGLRRISGQPNFRTSGGVIYGDAASVALVPGAPEGEEDGEGEGEGSAEGEGGVDPEGEGEGEEPLRHNADQDGDGRISLSELLRVIQFYNSTGYGCSTQGEDGYAPNSLLRNCPPHASDYNTQDWDIALTELLRLIQFYNSGGFHPCPDVASEDGFCPGRAARGAPRG